MSDILKILSLPHVTITTLELLLYITNLPSELMPFPYVLIYYAHFKNWLYMFYFKMVNDNIN